MPASNETIWLAGVCNTIYVSLRLIEQDYIYLIIADNPQNLLDRIAILLKILLSSYILLNSRR